MVCMPKVADERRNLQAITQPLTAPKTAQISRTAIRPPNTGMSGNHGSILTCIVNILQQHSGQTSGQTYHTSGRQVGTFCNQTARNTTSDDESRRNVDQQVFKVSQCKKFSVKTNKNCKKQNQNNNCVVGQKVSTLFAVIGLPLDCTCTIVISSFIQTV